MTSSTDISSTLREDRVFKPSEAFASKAAVGSFEEYKRIYDKSIADPEAFWAEQAENELHWFKKWDQVLDWQPPFAKWFLGGKINVCYNCVDRHVKTERRNKPAIIWEGEPGENRTLTYEELYHEDLSA